MIILDVEKLFVMCIVSGSWLDGLRLLAGRDGMVVCGSDAEKLKDVLLDILRFWPNNAFVARCSGRW